MIYLDNSATSFPKPESVYTFMDQFYRKNGVNPGRSGFDAAIETEESKMFKVKMWDQILGRVVGMNNPKTPTAVNYILGQILEVMGGSFKHFKKFMFEEDQEAVMMYQLATGAKGMPSTPNMGAGGPTPQQNQRGGVQRGPEQAARGRAAR